MQPMYSATDTNLAIGGFPHSDISGSQPNYRLSEAFRRFSRPSSPPTAKAFTLCTYSFDHMTFAKQKP